jgi:DNA excision repair protein ERCC-3
MKFVTFVTSPLTYYFQLLSAMNPGKFRALKFLINYHEQRDDKVVVFSDNLVAMKYYASKLDGPLIEWETPINDRTTMVHFYQLNFADTIFVTKVVDCLLDLKETLKPNVVIQVSCHVGSREKHANRLERLLSGGKPSFLYILVSEKTDEVQLSKELDIYLSDVVSTFKVVNKFKGLGMVGFFKFMKAVIDTISHSILFGRIYAS